jgi:phosphomannomutase
MITVSGLRGVVGESLTPLVAMQYAAAFVQTIGPGPIVLARDGRATGPMLLDAVRSAVHALGRDTLEAGVVSTPTVGVLVDEHRAAGGIQVTASHNPPQYNGIKLFSAAARVVSAAEGQSVLQRYAEAQPAWSAWNAVGRCVPCPDPTAEHLRRVVALVDAARIARVRPRVLLDANHGSGAALGRRLLEALGCQVTLLGETPDGQFEHPPEPTEENLREVCQKVATLGADIGFCQDPDADRLAIVDEHGRYLSEECTLALCVEHVLHDWRQGTLPAGMPAPHRPAVRPADAAAVVVINCSTSRMTQDLADRYGVPCHRSPVGEAHVVDSMLAHGALLGGEGNGGVIDPRVGYVRDSFVAMALVLDLMAARRQRISALADALPRYAMLKAKFPLPEAPVADVLAAVEQHFADARRDRRDGLRLDWSDRWLHVRPSNTEPLLRVIVEAPDATAAEALCRQAAGVVAAQAASRPARPQ